jgi:hypothetical protein
MADEVRRAPENRFEGEKVYQHRDLRQLVGPNTLLTPFFAVFGGRALIQTRTAGDADLELWAANGFGKIARSSRANRLFSGDIT